MGKKIGFLLFVFTAFFSLVYVICADIDRKPEWISALAAVVSAVGVVFVYWQLEITKSIAQLQFEDTLEKEYRDLAARIPTGALIGGELSSRQYRAAFDEFFRYFDLSNKQVMLRKHGRIGESTWKNWRSGIQFNLSLPGFKKAWTDVKEQTSPQKSEFFSELRKLEEENFQFDPKSWK